jgi:hypothetical protein
MSTKSNSKSYKSNFNYSNTQTHQTGGKKTVRNVIIKSGKGHKLVKYYKSGKLVYTVKRGLKPNEVSFIKMGKFIPGLFKDCPMNKTRKNRH